MPGRELPSPALPEMIMKGGEIDIEATLRSQHASIQACVENVLRRGKASGFAELDADGNVPGKDAASGYAGLDANSNINVDGITDAAGTGIVALDIGDAWPKWHLGKNGVDQNDLGTSAELVTWANASTYHLVEGVTWTDADDSITILTTGIYVISIHLLWANTLAAGDRIDTYLYIDGGNASYRINVSPSGNHRSQTLTLIIRLAANEVLTVYGANRSVATRGDINGTSILTSFTGALIAKEG